MLAKQYRLPRSISFFQANSVATPFFRVLSKPNDLLYNRFGFVISKKIDKRAVVRNRLRRVLREAVSRLLETKKGKDMLFIVKTSFEKESTESMVRLVSQSVEKLS